MSQSDIPAEQVTRVELPTALVEAVETRVEYTDFEDASAYVEFVIEEVLASLDDAETNYDAVDRSEVESRLESLGYME